MTIYILDEDLEKSAQYLDDKSLDKQIKDICQVLCNVHHMVKDEFEKEIDEWVSWTRDCEVNHMRLVEYGFICQDEYDKRLFILCDDTCSQRYIKYLCILEWARDNIPDFPLFENNKFLDAPPFPLIMPSIFKHGFKQFDCEQGIDSVFMRYRSYYQHKLSSKPIIYSKLSSRNKDRQTKWTNRNKPDWINL